jgi:P-type Cu2+ transporter
VPAGRDDAFCCTGCQYVFNLLQDQGLDQFYDLKGGKMLSPVSPDALRERDYEWLESLVEKAEAACPACEGQVVELRLSVQGLSCVGCVWLIEKVFSRQPGALRITVDVTHGEVRMEWQVGGFDAVAFARELQSFGYLLGTVQVRGGERRERSGLERRMGACGAFAMNAMAFSLPAYFGMPQTFPFAGWFTLIAAASATLAMLVGGSYFIERAWRSLRVGVLHIDTPIALGILAAFAGSLGGWAFGVEGLLYFDFVAVFVFLMLAGRWAQQAAVERNRRKLLRDTSIPSEVRLVDGEEKVAVSELAPGMQFRVKQSQTLPVAARLLSLTGSVSLEWINGESEVQQREAGQLLPSGVLNVGARELEVEAVEAWADSTLHRLLEARREVEFRDHGLERLLRIYLATVVVVGVAGALWWWARGAGVAQALQVMISVFVVSCPCALGVAIPLAEELASARAEKMGCFVRTLGFWKKLLRLNQVVFDKTGTLTMENPQLETRAGLEALDGEAEAALRRLVTGNLHPVSRSLFEEIGPGAMLDGEVEERVGDGLMLRTAAGQQWTLGRPGVWDEAEGRGPFDVVLCREGRPVQGFCFSERLRPDSVAEVKTLVGRGIAVVVLSGDREEKVAGIANQLGLAAGAWQGRLTPDGKAEWLRSHGAERSLFIGDGANDSLAFDAALCAGSPISGRSFLEQKADFFFLGHSLAFVSRLLGVARQHRLAVRRVFAFSVAYNIGAAALGLAGHLNPLMAAILMPLSSLVTMSLVALTFRRQPDQRLPEELRAPAPIPLGGLWGGET